MQNVCSQHPDCLVVYECWNCPMCDEIEEVEEKNKSLQCEVEDCREEAQAYIDELQELRRSLKEPTNDNS